MKNIKIAISFVVMLMLGMTLQPKVMLGADSTAVNPKPEVIPSLREWQGETGSFTIATDARIVIDPRFTDNLNKMAAIFKKDLKNIAGKDVSIVMGKPQAGDFFLTLDCQDTTIGEEGYLFEVKDYVVIRANTHTGVFFGTRTALQILLQDPGQNNIPKGVARDWPKYEVRGFMLDVGRRYFSMDFLKQIVKAMAWFKMSDFQVHLSDNAIFKDPSRKHWDAYSAFRLESDTFPKLTATDGSYSKEEFQAFINFAQQRGVAITPEIDTPSHALAMTKLKPDLVHPELPVDHLDITNPKTIEFVKSIWEEYLEYFENVEYVHIGADEFYADNPKVIETYRKYMNKLNAFIKSKGKKTRAWGSLRMYPGDTPVDKDIVLNIWSLDWQHPDDAVQNGFDIINTLDTYLYIVPTAGYYRDYLNTEFLYKHWLPSTFSRSPEASVNIDPDNPHLLGGMFAVWNDKVKADYTAADVYDRVIDAIPTMAQKMWSADTEQSYKAFRELSKVIGTDIGILSIQSTGN